MTSYWFRKSHFNPIMAPESAPKSGLRDVRKIGEFSANLAKDGRETVAPFGKCFWIFHVPPLKGSGIGHPVTAAS